MFDAESADRALFETAPLVRVPVFSELPSLAENSIRYLATKRGLMLEVNYAWLYSRVLLAPSRVDLSFGELPADDVVELKCGPIPRALLAAFVAGAMEKSPLETAAVIVWNERLNEFSLHWTTQDASSHRVRYVRPRLAVGEHMVVDIHSHGRLAAFFSTEDDADDAGEIKVSAVVGNCDGMPTMEARLCMLGAFIPLQVLAAGALGKVVDVEEEDSCQLTR